MQKKAKAKVKKATPKKVIGKRVNVEGVTGGNLPGPIPSQLADCPGPIPDAMSTTLLERTTYTGQRRY